MDECTKDQLVKIADCYGLDVGDRCVKETVKANLKVHLFKMKVLGSGEAGASAFGVGLSLPIEGLGASLVLVRVCPLSSRRSCLC